MPGLERTSETISSTLPFTSHRTAVTNALSSSHILLDVWLQRANGLGKATWTEDLNKHSGEREGHRHDDQGREGSKILVVDRRGSDIVTV